MEAVNPQPEVKPSPVSKNNQNLSKVMENPSPQPIKNISI
jgi:hypothetical protein